MTLIISYIGILLVFLIYEYLLFCKKYLQNLLAGLLSHGWLYRN